MSIGLKTGNGAICTLSLSFNNDGPLGTFFRYICDNGTYTARYDELLDGKNNPIDVSQLARSMPQLFGIVLDRILEATCLTVKDARAARFLYMSSKIFT